MAQNSDNNNHKAPLATNSDSMSPGKNNSGSDESKSSNHRVVVGATDKGKGVVKMERKDKCSRSKGKISTPHVVVVARDGRSGSRHGDREFHIATKHERTKRMSEMFTKLHDLLPTLPDKVEKSNILMEAIHYIKRLKGKLSELEMQLAEGKADAVVSGGVSSSEVEPTPTSYVEPASVVLPSVGFWPTGPGSVPAGIVGAVTMAPASAPVGLQAWSGPNFMLSLSGNFACINVCVARRPGMLSMMMAVLEKYKINMVMLGISCDNAQRVFTIHARINGASSQFGDNVSYEDIFKLAVSEIMVSLSK